MVEALKLARDALCEYEGKLVDSSFADQAIEAIDKALGDVK